MIADRYIIDLLQDHDSIHIEATRYKEGKPVAWKIGMDVRRVVSKKQKQFIYEPIPSSRSSSFYKDCRFDTAEKAFAFWEKHKETILKPYERGTTP